MVLQFKNFQVKSSRNTYLKMDLELEKGIALTIFDKDLEKLSLIKKTLRKEVKFEGLVVLGDVTLNKKNNILTKEDIGLYPYYSILKNLKKLLALYGIKIEKENLIKQIEKLSLNPNVKFSKLEKIEKEKVKYLFLSLFPQEFLLFDLVEDNELVNDVAFEKFVKSLIETQEKTILILSGNFSSVSLRSDVVTFNDKDKDIYLKNENRKNLDNFFLVEILEMKEGVLNKLNYENISVLGNKILVSKEKLEYLIHTLLKEKVEVLSVTDLKNDEEIFAGRE